MIDIHTHILPAVDDGAKDLEQSLAMLRMAADAGTTDVVATCHSNPRYIFDPQLMEMRIAELQTAAGITVRIHYGCELHLTLDGIENAMRSPDEYSIAHKGYLLVEFSDLLIPRTSSEILSRMLDRGLRPIIAHPERNPLLRTRLTELEGWIELGCATQVTGQSLMGRFGKSAKVSAHELITKGLVHFLASDAHDLEHRPPVLNDVRQYIEETFDQDTAMRLLEENPRAVLEGGPLASGVVPLRKKPWFSLW
jgi:protein-tyrosine phosphatase